MGQLNPHLRDVDDFRHKLWTHLFVMSNFELDVESPYEIPEQETLNEKPSLMEYPKSKIRYGHYGKYTENILAAANEVVDEEEKAYLSKSMGNFMKKQFLTFNNTAVENHVIANQMKELSKGHLEIDNPDDLISTNQVLKQIGVSQNQNQNNRKKNIKSKKKKK